MLLSECVHNHAQWKLNIPLSYVAASEMLAILQISRFYWEINRNESLNICMYT